MNFDIELTSTPITSHAGLAFIGEKLSEAKFERHMAGIGPASPRSDRIPDADLAKTMVGLICCGKPHYDAVGEYAGDPYFPQVLGLKRLPSPEILRQRIEALPTEAGKAFRGFTTRLLAAHREHLSEEYHGRPYLPVHIDVTPMDNSGSHKEGVSWTYKKFDGYAPIFAYVGPHGFMLDNELRPGSSYCNTKGTKPWLKQVLAGAEQIAPEDTPRLVVTDAGHDAAENLLLLEETPDCAYVVKYNLRKQDPADWLAKPDGQLLMEPEITIDGYWTSLGWTPQQIQRFYEQRGTSEQFHSELKTDLDLERLPSGKFAANQHVLDLGMMAYNLLRLMGQQMLDSGLVPGRKADSRRLRLRTVLQNLIYMAGRVVRHARRQILRIFEGHGWAQAALSLARGPD